MNLYSVHCIAAGKRMDNGVRECRWMMMPIQADTLAMSCVHPELLAMCSRLTEGLLPPIVVHKQSYLTWGKEP